MANLFAFVTLLTSDSYLPGALALAGALKDVHPSPPVHPEVDFQTVCLVTPETVDAATIKLLRRAFNVVIGVELIGLEDDKNLQLLGRPDLHSVLTKLHIFRLVQYKKIIFLDADVLPIRPLSHLFHIEHDFSAAPDVGWPDIFNSGVLVLTPGNDKFEDVRAVLNARGSWDGGDQGVLNEWRGSDWNRLSFTYNTTPTAAYTYAPAYERFGSQISAIHFIGPNKPWKAIPYRPSRYNQEPQPSSSNSQSPTSPTDPTAPVQLQAKPVIQSPLAEIQAYDYESLVDRWFAVYDAHYRSQSLVPDEEFEVKRFMSAWDEDSMTGADMLDGPAAAPSTSSHSSRPGLNFGPPTGLAKTGVSIGGQLSLEDLRRLALEGMGRGLGTGVSGDSGEGEYLTLPLDGRVDLVRPRRIYPSQDTHSYEEEPRTPVGDYGELQIDGSPVRWTTLPTPSPNAVPPAPHIGDQSLPVTPVPPPGRYRRGTFSGQVSPTAERTREHYHHAKHNSHQQNIPQPVVKQELLRVPSPPLLAWNPAIEPPPRNTPSPSAFPPDTYYPNVWDHKRDHNSSSKSASSDGVPDVSSATTPPQPDSNAFFEVPPPGQIPQQLLRQGHYRQVTGDGESSKTPSPDLNKVKSVFPWEEHPRRQPKRVFPESDILLPGTFIPPPPVEPPSPLAFSSPERQTGGAKLHNLQPPSPLHLNLQPKKEKKLTFVNAWDTVPQITKYANRLARPAPAPSPLSLAPPFEENRRWDDPASRDGDDEGDGGDGDDEGDGGLDEEGSPTGRWNEDEDGERPKPKVRARSGSGSISASKMTKGKYRMQGVQTMTRPQKSISVQVGTGTETEKPLERRPNPRRKSVGGTITPPAALSRPAFVDKVDLLNGPGSPFPAFRSPSGFRAPRESRPSQHQASSESPSPTRRVSVTGATTPKQVRFPPPHERRISETSATSVTSPPSSVGPMSPAEGQAIGMPGRPGGRVWDPARGVELFKRGSEEVLARFLRMGSFEDEGQQHPS
ncbi:hypothetical protein HWV62_42546 [Athelia sp. TMB]|nr:hypothetical protein HWV62_42546 [Athelia sp. TMB]